MTWWRHNQREIRKGQRFRKKNAVHGEFICVVVGKAKRDGIKAICTDGMTHNFSRRVLLTKWEIIE